MFKELLAIYKSADDKTNIFRDQIPEDKYDAVISALETEDEAKFNDVMNAEPVSNEPVETTPAEAPQVDAPAVAETESLVEDSTLPEGPIVDQPEMVTEDQQKVILPTLDAVMHMTQDIKEASDEEIAQLPEELQEGVNIVREANDDFSMRIIAEVVDRLHHGDFSEIEEPSDKEILVTTAEAAKDLVDKGEHKTSLMRATEDIQKDLETAKLSDLIRMHTELCNLELCAKDLVEDVIEKNDLAVTPKEKEEIVAKVIDDNIFEDVTEDNLKNDIAEVIKESKDYSSRDMSEQLDIFRDFSQIKLDFDEGILSEDTVECIETLGSEPAAKEAIEEAIVEVTDGNPEVLANLDASIDLKSIWDSVKGAAGKAGNWVAKNPGKATGAALGAVAAIPAAKTLGETDENDSKMNKVGKKMVGAATLAGGAFLGSKAGDALQSKITKGKAIPVEASCGDKSESKEDKHIELTDKMRKKFDKAKTNNPYILSEAFLPSRPTLKFMYDVEKESDYNNLLSSISDEKVRNEIIAKKDALDLEKNKGMGFLPQNLWYGPAGAVYHTSKKNVKATNDLLDEMRSYNEFAEKETVSTAKRVLNTMFGIYPKQVSSSNRSEYWDAVKEVSKLSDEDKQKVFDELYKNNKKRTGTLWEGAAASTILGASPITAPVSNVPQLISTSMLRDTVPNRYRNMTAILAKDHSEDEAATEGELNQDVINNALSNDDQIRALVEKYKMLPTVEAKDQMKADMQTLGFGDDVIAMIEQYAEGNFSEGEDAPAEEVSTEAAPKAEAPAEETVDVASQVAPELFDELLGPGVGETDPVDGTLPPGEIEAPGTDLGHLGTFDQGIPSGEVVPEDDKEVAKVQIVNAEEDNFDDIMR